MISQQFNFKELPNALWLFWGIGLHKKKVGDAFGGVQFWVGFRFLAAMHLKNAHRRKWIKVSLWVSGVTLQELTITELWELPKYFHTVFQLCTFQEFT